jgi:hypothetical protein
MNKALKSVTVLALLSSVAFAGEEAKDLKKKIEDQAIYVETAKPGIVLSGYVDAGYQYSFTGSGTTGSTRNGGDRTVSGGRFDVNAVKLAIEKPLSTKNEFTSGFRVDGMYGADVGNGGITGYGATPVAGNGASFGVEQAYVQLRVPAGNGIDLKIGKFVTILGYEVIERPANLNVSYSNVFNNLIPLTHTGILAAYKVNDIVDVKFGVVNGGLTDTNNNAGIGGQVTKSNSSGILASVNLTAPGGNANIQNAVYFGFNTTGANSGLVAPAPLATSTEANPLWIYDIVGTWKPKFAGDKLTLGVEGDLGQFSGVTPAITEDTTTWGGAAIFAKYQFTKIFSLADRLDWIHSDDGQKFNAGFGSSDVYSETLTASFDVWENTLLRAEYRADFGTNAITTTGGTTQGIAHLVELEVVYSF